jgi:protein-glutamine gamma-glutamyltransferase
MWSTSRISILTVSVSAAGILSLALSGLLPLPALLIIMGIHIWTAFNFRWHLPLTTRQTLLLTAAVFLAQIIRILLEGSPVILLSLRDIIVYFAVLRLVLPKTGREIYQITAIGLTECILSTIFTLSPLFLIGLALMGGLIPMILSALDREEFGDAAEGRTGFLHWIEVYSGIVIAACILFFLIPRPSSAILKYGLDTRAKRGFSEETNLARKDDIGEDRQILMRIFWDRGDAPALFYLPGSRLDALTQGGFTKSPSRETRFLPAASRTDRLTVYQTDLEAFNVFYPFAVSGISPPLVSWKGLNLYWTSGNPPVYQVWVDRAGDRTFRAGLDIPEGLRDAASLGRAIAGDSPPEVRIKRLVEHLHKRCAYTLEGLPIPPGVSPMRWFLFDGRRGSCEHFASALAVMLRGCGIHARVATGFLVHELNEAGGYYIVRASDAHAWVEYYHEGAWQTLEATPRSFSPAQQATGFMDALRFTWLRWVIRYSLTDQIGLAFKLSSAPRNLELKLGCVLAGTVALAAIALVLWLVTLGLKAGKAGCYGSVARALARRGVILEEGATHEEHLEQVAREWPAIREDFRAFLDAYLSWRFGTGRGDMGNATSKVVSAIKKGRPPRIN